MRASSPSRTATPARASSTRSACGSSPTRSVAIVGPTGVGKSTLAQLLVRLDDPDDGEVLIGGVNLRHADAASLRDATAIVFQESFLFAAPVRENIGLGHRRRPGGDRARRATVPGGRVHPPAARRLRHRGGRARPHALGRAASTRGAGACARAEATPADPGRCDVARSTRRSRPRSSARCAASCGPRSSWSPTGSRRSAWPTGCCTSRTAAIRAHGEPRGAARVHAGLRRHDPRVRTGRAMSAAVAGTDGRRRRPRGAAAPAERARGAAAGPAERRSSARGSA